MNNEGGKNQPATQYLYGAAVQGIQGFIFQTNTLAEIVGASELVEEICTNLFKNVLKSECGIEKENDDNAIVNAAGNIKYIFDNKEDCAKVVRIFPKTVMEHAPGITISQAVVGYAPEKDNKEQDAGFANAVQELECRLRIQRNKLMRDTTVGLMGIERSRQTGLPVTHITSAGNHIDEGTYLKLYTDSDSNKGKTERKNTTQKLCYKAFGKSYNPSKVPFDIAKITAKNDWIAIIHADGNGLGQVVQKIGTDSKKLKTFSKKLDDATTAAAVAAFQSLEVTDTEVIPVRPIVLSGDDHTLICRADIALKYVESFIINFEQQTKNLLGNGDNKQSKGNLLEGVFKDNKNYLTACAGIAFIKSSYPFYYGYQLAETLCDRAKKDTKALYDANDGNLPASCVMFHKVQDSFIASYDDIVKRELTPKPDVSFEFGPYYINVERNDRWTLGTLMDRSDELKVEDMRPVKTGLRNWLSLIHMDSDMASQRLDRLKYISGKYDYIDKVTTSRGNEEKKIYPVYDILTINAVNTKDTKTKKETTK